MADGPFRTPGPGSMPNPGVVTSRTGHARTYFGTRRFDGDWPISAESRTNAQVNPQLQSQADGTSYMGPSSNCVTPMPTYLPRIPFVDWLLVAFSYIRTLLDPDGELERRGEIFVESAHHVVDMDDYLPTSYDDMRDWRTVPGGI